MNDTRPGHGREGKKKYKKDDGTFGLIDTSAAPEITMVPEGFADVATGTFDPATGILPYTVDHNGSIGNVVITITADVDLGSGFKPLASESTFDMLTDAGATGVEDEVGPERPTP